MQAKVWRHVVAVDAGVVVMMADVSPAAVVIVTMPVSIVLAMMFIAPMAMPIVPVVAIVAIISAMPIMPVVAIVAIIPVMAIVADMLWCRTPFLIPGLLLYGVFHGVLAGRFGGSQTR